MNDANCFAVSEAFDGAGAGAPVVLGAILGTGVGAGIVVAGHLLLGPNLIAGEWGHNPMPYMSPREARGSSCYCGKRGCIETFLSGPAFEADYFRRTQRRATSKAIVAAATQDEAADATLSCYHDRLARALSSVVNILDPDRIVLGGGMSNIPYLAEAVSARLAKYVFSDTVVTEVVRNKHGDSSGVRGAAFLWPPADV